MELFMFIAYVALMLFLAWVAFEVVLGAVIACSVLRFSYYCRVTATGSPPSMKALPKAFVYRWFEHVGTRRGDITIRSKYGAWYWIGDWHVYETFKETK